MLVERSEITIREDALDQFLAGMRTRGLQILTQTPGARTVQFGRGVENPDKFIILIEWETMEAHTAFAQSAVFNEFKDLIMPFSKGGLMEHFRMD